MKCLTHVSCSKSIKSLLRECAGAKQGGRVGHADKMLKAHSRDLGQRQQLVHAKLHQGHPPTKSAGASSHLWLLMASASVVTQSVAVIMYCQEVQDIA